ncbi:MAG: acireductone synthase [Vicinamibacterales bacterium]
MTFSLAAAGVGVVLLDIEGTTTPIEFVHRTLFAFARTRVRDYLAARTPHAEIDAALDGLREEHAADVAAGQSPPPWRDDPADARLESVAVYVGWLIDRDRKSRWLKELQGRIWEEGYLRGALRGEVYPDVPAALRRWTAAGVRVGIFSSGSVLAQKLLFAHSTAGDLTPLLRWHFDTAVGPKTEAASYLRIAEQVSSPPDRLLFISDVTKEIDAARAAGFQTLLCVRPPAAPPVNADTYPIVRTFEEIG